MSHFQLQLTPGCIVEFLQENQTVLSCVLEVLDKQVRVLNINKRLLKLPAARILPWTGPVLDAQSSRQSILEALQYREQLRTDLQSRVNPLELWEIVQDELHEVSTHWLASLLWQTPQADEVAALGRNLLRYKTHFKFVPPKFKPHDAQTVQNKLQEQEKAQRKNLLLTQGHEFLHNLWARQALGQNKEIFQLPGDLEQELQQLLFKGIADPEDNDFLNYWNKLSKGLPDHPHLPLLLAQYWGLLPRHYNHLLDQAGYSWGDEWSQDFASEINRLHAEFTQRQQHPEPLGLVSIDSSTTKDIDDAFCLLPSTDSTYEICLAVACPVLGWDFQSALDRAVAHRFSSLYLPEGVAHMLPESLGTELFSLHAGQNKPVLLLHLKLDPEGNLLCIKPRLTWSALQDNLTYAQVEKSLKEKDAAYLTRALELANYLREKRIRQGAVIIEQEEPIIKLFEDQQKVQVDLEEPRTYPRAQLLVSEFMILANQALAHWAQEHDLPLLYRTQDINLSRKTAGVWRDPVQIFQVMREMSSSRLDNRPRPHASLGVQAYAPMTSPLRRYSDLVNLAQLFHFIQYNHKLFSYHDLEQQLPYLSSRAQETAKIQKFRNRYWKLLYLQTWCKQSTWPGVVVSEDGGLVTVSMPREQLLLRAPSHMFGDKIAPGKKYRLKLGKIDPLNNEIKILDAWEE